MSLLRSLKFFSQNTTFVPVLSKRQQHYKIAKTRSDYVVFNARHLEARD